jgi:hypothetical protein
MTEDMATWLRGLKKSSEFNLYYSQIMKSDFLK